MKLKRIIKFRIKVRLNHKLDWLEYEPYTKLVVESE
jgi:hypothetical protein